MNKLVLLFLVFIGSHFKTFSQSSSVYLPYPSDVCVSGVYNVTVYPSGFSIGVTINILLSNDNFVSSVIIGTSTYSGAYSQIINCIIPPGTIAGINYKVKASAAGVPPANNYASGTFIISSSVPSASLTGVVGFDACGGNANLPIQITGIGNFTFQYQRTGDAYSISGQSSLNSPLVQVNQSGTYTLQSVSNACGNGTIFPAPNNQATVNVNPPLLTIGTPSDDIVCIGNKIKIPFTSSQPCYTYTIQISDNTGNNYTNTSTEYDSYNLPGILTATIPNLSQTPGSGYKLRVKVNVNYVDYFSDPSVVTLTLKAKPRINSFTILDPLESTYPGTIAKGENIKYSLDLVGEAPFLIKINEVPVGVASGPTYVFQISPTQSNRDIIGAVSDATGCVNETQYYSDVEVKDYIFKNRILENKSLDIYSKFRMFCKSEYIHLDYNVRTAQHPDSILVQVANYEDLNKGINDWVNATFEKSADNQLSIKIPNGLRKGRYSLRLIPRNPLHSYKSYDYTIINDYIISTDFILMDAAIGELTGQDKIIIAPNEPFYLFYKFEGGPDFYGSSLGSLKVYKPVLKTNKGQIIKYSSTIGLGFSALMGTTLVDTVSKSIDFILSNVEASTSAAGDISCNSSQGGNLTDSLKVIVIPNDPLRSITTAAISNPSNLCSGSNVTVPYTISGSFNPGNILTVQLQQYSDNYSTVPISNFFDVVTVAGVNPNELVATLPIDAIKTTSSYYRVRIISSNPGIIGSTSPTLLLVNKRPPYIELAGEAFVMAGETAKVKVKTTNSYPYFSFKIGNGIWESSLLSSGSFTTSYFTEVTVNTPPAASVGTILNYTSSLASNSCGNSVNTGVGLVQIVATPKITITAPTVIVNCNPGKLTLSYATGLYYGTDNLFTAKVWHNYYGVSSPTYVGSVVVKKSGNVLSIDFPSTYTPVNGTIYSIQVFSSSPYANSNIVTFTMNTSPTFYSSPSSVSVDQGSSTNLVYTLYGSPNFAFSLDTDDGLQNKSSSGNYTYISTPQYSKTYKLSNLSDANCPANLAASGPTVTVIEKKQDIEIESFGYSSLCLGSTINVPFLYTGSYSSFTLQLSDQDGLNFADISSSVVGNVISGTIPLSLAIGSNYKIRIKGQLTTGGTRYSLPNLFGLSKKGSVTAVLSGSDYLVRNPNFLNFILPDKELRVDFTGTGAYTFDFSDGLTSSTIHTTSNPHFIRVNPLVTTTYTISNLSNDCVSGTSSGSATINVITITTGNLPYDACRVQEISIPFTKVGTFDPLNQYFVDFQLITPYNNTNAFSYNFRTLPATVSGSNLLVTIPADFPLANGIFTTPSSYFRARVRSTIPAALGTWGLGSLGVYSGAPTVQIFGSTNILTGGTITPLNLTTSNVAGYTTVNYTTSGGGSSSFSFYGNQYAFNVSPTLTSTYTITSINSACGAGLIGNPSSATITIGPCPANQSMSLNMESGIIRKFETSGVLDAINVIRNGANIQYDAQQSIILYPGFKVETGAVFKAYIDGCGGF